MFLCYVYKKRGAQHNAKYILSRYFVPGNLIHMNFSSN